MDGSSLLIIVFLIVGGAILIATRGSKFSTIRLVGVQGQYQGKNIPISSNLVRRGPFSVGRSHKNQLVIHNDLVSREHAQIMLYGPNQWVLYDRGSANGTRVNGERIAQHNLRSGDQIQIGSSVFVFNNNSQPSAIPSPPAVIRQHQPTPPPTGFKDIDLRNYEKIQELGAGGAATVFKAKNRNGELVAIKFLTQPDTYLRQKFQGEIRVGQTLRHPNIARIYGGDIPADGSQPYIVMEYVDGYTLRHLITSQKQLPPDKIVSVIGQTCDALQYAHQLQVYHRDIKPENIMVNTQNQIKLIDFGVARIASQTTHTADGMIVGTPFYLSYEQAKGHPVDGRSDIYSLGVVLYEMLTGHVPFFSQDTLEIVHYHVTQMPMPPSRINPQIPSHLEQITLRCLDKDKNRRFQTPVELAQAIGYTPQMVGNIDDSIVIRPGPSTQIVVSTGHIIPIKSVATQLCRRDINPGDNLISREHARVVNHNGRYWLEDLSTNGTFLNGMRIDQQPALLQPGDRIQVGNTLMRFEAG